MALRVVIDEAKFRELVAGKVASCWTGSHQVEVTLADIGLYQMMTAILAGMDQPPPPDPPEAREFLPQRKKRK